MNGGGLPLADDWNSDSAENGCGAVVPDADDTAGGGIGAANNGGGSDE